MVLEANDAGIALARGGEVLCRQPGVALVDGREVLFGDDALAKARLRPRQAHNEFWQRLNADPVTPPGRGVANQADLVYLHLVAIKETLNLPADSAVDVVVAAPSTASAAQLSLLLGIAGEAGFKVRAFVDAAVAAASTLDLPAACRLVDVSLHRATVTALALEKDEDGAPRIRRGAVDEVPAAGLAPLMEGWIDAVADRFVETTRFDPLRVAATEQQVFDQVRAQVDQAADEFAIAVQHDGHARQITVPRRAFAEKAAQRYGVLAKAIGAPGVVLLAHRASQPPGLAAHLEAAGHRLLPVHEDAVANALAAHAERLVSTDGGVRFVTSLPARATAAETPVAARPRLPTHLLCEGMALRIGEQLGAGEHPAASAANGFRLERRGEGCSVVPTTADVRLNGQPVAFERAVAVGDVVHCQGVDFQLIAVVDSGHAAGA